MLGSDDLIEIIEQFYEAAKPFVQDDEHIDLLVEVLKSIQEMGYDARDFYGNSDDIDEALKELYPGLDNDDDFDDEDEY